MEKIALVASLCAIALAAGLMLGHARGPAARRVEWALVAFAGAIALVMFAGAVTAEGFDLSLEKLSKATVVVATGALLVLVLVTVAKDANARGRRGGLWAILVFLTWPIGLALWTLVALDDRRRGRRGIGIFEVPKAGQRAGVAALAAVCVSWLALSFWPITATYTATIAFTRGSTAYQVGDAVIEDCGSAISVVAGTSPSVPSMNGLDLSNDFERSYALNSLVARDACSRQANPRIALSWCLVAFSIVATSGWWLSRRGRHVGGSAPDPAHSGLEHVS